MRAAIRMQRCSVDIAERDGVSEGSDGEIGRHPGVDRVPDDAVGLEVLDRAEVLYPLAIAVALDRPPSTISREIRRNGHRGTYRAV